MLSIAQLTKTYANGVKALQGIHLDIEKGMFGLLGPNGAGKSTLMRTIAALQTPDSGRILLNGVDIVRHPQAVREVLGYLPQEFGVYPKISAWQLLDHLAVLKGLSVKSDRKAQVEQLLHQTNLYAVRNKAVSSFSGGMRQRFGIAQALLGNPQLLIVDEPTAGLDPEERNRFHNLLSEVGEHIVVILSTHIVEDVRDLCSKMAILVNGKVMLKGKPAELVGNLRGQIWQKSVAKNELEELSHKHTVLSRRLKSGRPSIHVLSESQPESGFVPLEPNLEDVYFAVLAKAQGALPC